MRYLRKLLMLNAIGVVIATGVLMNCNLLYGQSNRSIKPNGSETRQANAGSNLTWTKWISVTYPSGGEHWQAGTRHNITWTSQNIDGNVIIEYWLNNVNYRIVSTSNNNVNGVYEWNIPFNQTPSNLYNIKISSANDTSICARNYNCFTISLPTGPVEEAENNPPLVFKLSQNYPNPITSGTYIEYTLPKNTTVSLNIYDINGELVRNLMTGNQELGFHKVYWDGQDNNGQKVSNGTYFYRMEAGSFKVTQKLTMLG
ncbi:MAG: FlgD immunoglobulin-like domain containing protein [bacterium]|nr:FlgD immunoglobulin-like domain containing protein [bacterium]